jgi:hypothetical protein
MIPTNEEASPSEPEAAQTQLRRIVKELEAIRYRLLGVHATLPAPPQDALLADEEEPGVAAALRSAIECALADRLEPAIRALHAAAELAPGRDEAPLAEDVR